MSDDIVDDGRAKTFLQSHWLTGQGQSESDIPQNSFSAPSFILLVTYYNKTTTTTTTQNLRMP
jgi:hypothetical protein